jgi:hypothetical protein
MDAFKTQNVYPGTAVRRLSSSAAPLFWTSIMPNFLNFPPFTEDGDVHVVIETPRGSRAKFDYDPRLH